MYGALALRLACFFVCVVFVEVLHWGIWLPRPPAGVLVGLLYSAFSFNVMANNNQGVVSVLPVFWLLLAVLFNKNVFFFWFV